MSPGNQRAPRLLSFDTIVVFVLVVSRVAINDLLDYTRRLPWELVRQVPVFGNLLSPHAVELLVGWWTDPLSRVLMALTLGFLLIYVLVDLADIGRGYPIRLILLYGMIFMTVVSSTALLTMVRHMGDELRYAHDGGVLQTETAVQYALSGKNPYRETYHGTPLEELRGSNYPAIQHYPYFPLTFLFSGPFYLLGQNLLGFYDQRLVYLGAFVLTLFLAPKLARREADKLGLVAVIGLNPTMASDVIIGMNDAFVLFWIALSIYLLQRERWISSGVALGLACASKSTAWLLVPFYLFYVWNRRGWTWQHLGYYVKRTIPWGVATAAIILPYFLWDPAAMLDDVWRFRYAFPITGWGFGTIVLALGLVPSTASYFPFWVVQAVLGLPLMGFLFWLQRKRPTLSMALLAGASFSFFFLYFARYTHGNFVGYGLALFALGYFSADTDLAL